MPPKPAAAPAQLPSKEASLFRHLVQNYESKQYKKGLKAADTILKKYPTHGDTQAMKALIMSSQGKTDEAFDLCKEALKNAMSSNVCWHVYGLLWRQVKNYPQAMMAYKRALTLDKDSVQIQRDLAHLQAQTRDYTGLVQTRRTMLQAKPAIRQNWTALAIALHLNGELDEAEDVLERFENTIKGNKPSRNDIEHSEAALYKISIIAEEGDLERALKEIDDVYKTALDKTAVMEMKADYLLRLDRKAAAETAYRLLLSRNAERRDYYDGLEKALGLDRSKQEDHQRLVEMYQSFAEKSERIDAARRIPLDFLEGDAFRSHAEQYLRRMFKKGVPSTFANVKQLYVEETKKRTLVELAESFLSEQPQTNGSADPAQANGSADGSHKPSKIDPNTTWHLSVNYYLAQHYDYHLSRDLQKAQQYIEEAIVLNPQSNDYTFHMTRARIMKHSGAVAKASEAMNNAREMDLKDRYINTKCAKYQLRNNEHETAVSTMGLFTRKEAVGGPLGDLTDMQCVWFLTEDGESYLRQGKLSLALKRFKTVYEIFETWTDDQFDFHSFSLRKGMVRAYVDMIRWEDKLRDHPFFTRAALSAIRIYCALHDRPQLVQEAQTNGANSLSAAEKKKAAKKARKEEERKETERKAAKAKQPTPKAEDEDAAKKEDTDPEGVQLLETKTPLDEAMKYVTPLVELSPKSIEGQAAAFEVYIRRKKYLPALRCLLAIKSLDPQHIKVHELSSRLKLALDSASEPLPEKTKEVMDSTFLRHLPSKSIDEANVIFASDHKNSAPHVHAAVKVRQAAHPEDETAKSKSADELLETLKLENLTLEDAVEGLRLLDGTGVADEKKNQYEKSASERFPAADIFASQR